MRKKMVFISTEDLDEEDSQQINMDESNIFDNSFKSGIYDYLNWFYDGEQDDFLL